MSASEVRDELLETAGAIEPGAVPLPEVSELWATFVEIARIATGMATLLTHRVDAAEAWRAAGFKSAVDALASASGTSVASAKGMLETSQQLASLPTTSEAVKRGELSSGKVEAIAAAAHADPNSEAKLLAGAGESLAEVRRECLRTRAAAEGDELYRRVRRERRAHEYTDAEGGWNFCARGPADKGAEFKAVLDDLTDEIFKERYASGAREPREAYAFDALCEMARRATTGEGTKPSRKWLAILRVDWEALRRGELEDEEVCEIAGIGPVPVQNARELLGDAVLKLVITKGVDVLNVTHLGRAATAAQRTALLWQSPTCEVEGCNRTHRLEIDHRVGWAKTKRTRLDELQRLCEHHHDLKTRYGWELVEGTGRRAMIPPPEP